MGKQTRQDNLTRQLKFITLFPAGAGTFMALITLFTQYWKWFQTGEWQGAPLVGFVPHGLVKWAAAKQGGFWGLKQLVLGLLSVHASIWFFVSGCLCTFVLYAIAKPWLKD